MRKLGCCLLMLVILFSRISCSASAAPIAQEPTPTVTQAQADALSAECRDCYYRGDFQDALEFCQAALPLYRQLDDRYSEAKTLNNIGRIYEVLSDYDQAMVHYQQALPIWQEIDHLHGRAATLNNIGTAYYNLSDYEQALAHFQQALPIWREINDQYGEAQTLANIGVAYHALLDYEQALIYYKQALPIQQAVDDQEGELTTLDGIAEIYHALSDYQQALYYYRQALTIRRGINDQLGEATTLGKIGSIYKDLFEYEQALTFFQQALSIYQEARDQAKEATTMNDIGMVYYALFDYQQALVYFEHALSVFREIGDSESIASTLHNIGEVHSTLFDYEQALAHLEQALEICQETMYLKEIEANTLNSIGGIYRYLSDYRQTLVYLQRALSVWEEIDDWTGQAITLNNIGVIYHDIFDLKRALDHYRQALAIQQEMGDRRGEAVTLNNIGEVYHDMLDYGQALVYFEQALDIYEEIGELAGEATTLNNVGAVHHALSDYEQSLIYYEQALSIQREVGDREAEATVLNNIGGVYQDMRNYDQALAYYHQGLSIRQEISDRTGEAITLSNIAYTQEALGQGKQALNRALRCVAVWESIYGELGIEGLQITFATNIADDYHHAIRLLLVGGREPDAFHYAERGRARTLLTLLGNQRMNPTGSENPDLIQQEAELRGQLAALERQLQEEWSRPADQRSREIIGHITANLEAHRHEYEDLLIQLQLTNPEYAALISVAPLTLEESQALLQEQALDATLVSYFVGEEETFIFVVGPETFHAESVAVTRQELRQHVEALLAQMKAAPILPDAWQKPAQALYDWLVAPVQEYLPPANPDAPLRLGIIPHDLLHYLPIGLLHDGENALLEGYTLFYAPSVSSLQFIFKKRHPEADTLLVLANPDAPGAPHLRYAVEEAQAVTALYETQPFIGPDATEGRLKAQAGEYGLVHLAAHSDYNPVSPLFSAILLQSDESEDGRLETHEVFNLDLPQTDLVVLSACQTHLGELSAGDELVGLERAFIRAGSPSLLTTLWPADDAATAKLMERFYIHLRAGVPKAEALRLAQMETRTEHPESYYWAGFVLVGDAGIPSEIIEAPRPTPAESKGGGGVCGGAAGLLGVAEAFGWRRRRRGRSRDGTG